MGIQSTSPKPLELLSPSHSSQCSRHRVRLTGVGGGEEAGHGAEATKQRRAGRWLGHCLNGQKSGAIQTRGECGGSLLNMPPDTENFLMELLFRSAS